MKQLIFILGFCSIALLNCARKSTETKYGSYFIDPSIKETIDNKVFTQHDIILSSMDFKVYENGVIIADTYSKGKSIDECSTLSSIRNDTINIRGFMGMFNGFGYDISIFDDTCTVTHFITSDMAVYKLSKEDPLSFGITIPCQTFKLTLTSKPSFSEGEIIEGIVELTSNDFYEEANDIEKIYKTQLTGYFRTEPLKLTHD